MKVSRKLLLCTFSKWSIDVRVIHKNFVSLRDYGEYSNYEQGAVIMNRNIVSIDKVEWEWRNDAFTDLIWHTELLVLQDCDIAWYVHWLNYLGIYPECVWECVKLTSENMYQVNTGCSCKCTRSEEIKITCHVKFDFKSWIAQCWLKDIDVADRVIFCLTTKGPSIILWLQSIRTRQKIKSTFLHFYEDQIHINSFFLLLIFRSGFRQHQERLPSRLPKQGRKSSHLRHRQMLF